MAANGVSGKPAPQSTPTAAQSPGAAAAAPFAAKAEPVEPLRSGGAEREVVPHPEGHALGAMQLLGGPGNTQEGALPAWLGHTALNVCSGALLLG